MNRANTPLATPGIHDRLDWKTQWRRMWALGWADLKYIGTETIGAWYRHNAPRLGASLAFYTLLSLAPLLIIVVAVAGAVFGREAAEGQLVWQIQDVVGRQGAETVQALLRGAQMPVTGTIASTLGLLTLLYGATAAMSELRSSLNTIWCVPDKEQTGLRSIISLLRDRGVAFAAVIAGGFLLLLSLAVNAALSMLGTRYSNHLPSSEFVLQSIDFLVFYVVIACIFALMYKLLPDLDLEWRDVIPGALVTALLFSIGKTFIGMYLGKATITSTYGAAGSLVAVLVWVYYSAQIFFLGAEFTQVYAQTYGSRPCDRIGKHVQIAGEAEVRPETHDASADEPLIKTP